MVTAGFRGANCVDVRRHIMFGLLLAGLNLDCTRGLFIIGFTGLKINMVSRRNDILYYVFLRVV